MEKEDGWSDDESTRTGLDLQVRAGGRCRVQRMHVFPECGKRKREQHRREWTSTEDTKRAEEPPEEDEELPASILLLLTWPLTSFTYSVTSASELEADPGDPGDP